MDEGQILKTFYHAVKESYEKYLIAGDRSEIKLIPIHSWVGKTIEKLINKEYEIYFLNKMEVEVEGRYYPKIVDVAIVKKGTQVRPVKKRWKSILHIPQAIMVISLKFITSNFKQNANNYFENLLGECANLRARGMKFAHLMILRNKIPYFEKDGKLTKWEDIDDDCVFKYITLYADSKKGVSLPHIPDVLGMEVVDINPIIEDFYKRKPKFSHIEVQEALSNANFADISVKNGIAETKLSPSFKKQIKEVFSILNFLRTCVEQIRG